MRPSGESSALLTPCFWTSSLQSCEEIHFCRKSASVVVLCHSSPSSRPLRPQPEATVIPGNSQSHRRPPRASPTTALNSAAKAPGSDCRGSTVSPHRTQIHGRTVPLKTWFLKMWYPLDQRHFRQLHKMPRPNDSTFVAQKSEFLTDISKGPLMYRKVGEKMGSEIFSEGAHLPPQNARG